MEEHGKKLLWENLLIFFCVGSFMLQPVIIKIKRFNFNEKKAKVSKNN
jgi:hypothetical protein